MFPITPEKPSIISKTFTVNITVTHGNHQIMEIQRKTLMTVRETCIKQLHTIGTPTGLPDLPRQM